eukprot:m.66593 g.66593  ORF g.66593 m.66593 type:complete len:473 (+) comp12126_c1_seq1:3070-4488(+)
MASSQQMSGSMGLSMDHQSLGLMQGHTIQTTHNPVQEPSQIIPTPSTTVATTTHHSRDGGQVRVPMYDATSHHHGSTVAATLHSRTNDSMQGVEMGGSSLAGPLVSQTSAPTSTSDSVPTTPNAAGSVADFMPITLPAAAAALKTAANSQDAYYSLLHNRELLRKLKPRELRELCCKLQWDPEQAKKLKSERRRAQNQEAQRRCRVNVGGTGGDVGERRSPTKRSKDSVVMQELKLLRSQLEEKDQKFEELRMLIANLQHQKVGARLGPELGEAEREATAGILQLSHPGSPQANGLGPKSRQASVQQTSPLHSLAGFVSTTGNPVSHQSVMMPGTSSPSSHTAGPTSTTAATVVTVSSANINVTTSPASSGPSSIAMPSLRGTLQSVPVYSTNHSQQTSGMHNVSASMVHRGTTPLPANQGGVGAIISGSGMSCFPDQNLSHSMPTEVQLPDADITMMPHLAPSHSSGHARS